MTEVDKRPAAEAEVVTPPRKHALPVRPRVAIDWASSAITLKTKGDVDRVIDWVVNAQLDCPDREFRCIDDDSDELRAQLRTWIDRPLHFLQLLNIVENYDVWFTGHNEQADIGRRGFLGRMMCAGLEPSLPSEAFVPAQKPTPPVEKRTGEP